MSFHLPRTEILITRIPVFLLGMNLGKYVFEGAMIEDRNRVFIIRASSVLAVLLLLTIYIDWVGIELVRLIYFFCAIPTLFFALMVSKGLPFLKSVLAFFGSISYELYLLHQHIVLKLCSDFPVPKVVYVLLSYVIAVILAYSPHLAVTPIVKHYSQIR